MKLPNWENAIVPREKVVDYLMNFSHEEGNPKAVFFMRFGFSSAEWEVLAEALIRHAGEHDVDKSVTSKFGVRYSVVGELDTPDGRRPVVNVIWSVDVNGARPRLITAYPGRRRKDD